MTKRELMKVRFSQPEDSQKVLSTPPSLTSHNTKWRDIFVEYHCQPGCDTGEYISLTSHIGVNGRQELPDSQERWLDGHFQKENLRYGDIIIVPAGVPHRSVWHGKAEFTMLSFEPTWLERTAQELIACDHLELIKKSRV